MSSSITIRPCDLQDLPQILNIYNHYIENSVVTLDVDLKSLTHIKERFDAARKENLPFLVALLPPDDAIAGYAYATQLRLRLGYAGSVEVAIYLHQAHIRRGLGRTLLLALLQKLRDIPESEQRPHGIREVFAIASLDPADDIRPFYRKLGFEDVAHLKNVGWKFGSWWDTTYGQLSLVNAESQTT